MRKQVFGILAALSACTVLMIAPSARADGWHTRSGYGVDYVDPYAYSYEPRRYYPYYNSGYWRPAAEVRLRRAHRYTEIRPPYYQAWGYPRPYQAYQKRSWRHRW